jgi:hypothetical protein
MPKKMVATFDADNTKAATPQCSDHFSTS